MSREIKEGPDDDRQDEETRNRLDELTASWTAAVQRLDARYKRTTHLNIANSVVSLFCVLFCFVLLARTSDVSEANRRSLCTFRLDLEQRVSSSKQFLKDHPNGVGGISRADILMGITNQERTIKSLGDMDCEAYRPSFQAAAFSLPVVPPPYDP